MCVAVGDRPKSEPRVHEVGPRLQACIRKAERHVLVCVCVCGIRGSREAWPEHLQHKADAWKIQSWAESAIFLSARYAGHVARGHISDNRATRAQDAW